MLTPVASLVRGKFLTDSPLPRHAQRSINGIRSAAGTDGSPCRAGDPLGPEARIRYVSAPLAPGDVTDEMVTHSTRALCISDTAC
jgi:hypothetical protein